MSKYLILGLTAALLTVLLFIGISVFGLKVASKALEKKVSAIHIQKDVLQLKEDSGRLDTNLQVCKPLISDIEQLTEMTNKNEYEPAALLQTRISIARTAQKAANCYKEKAWDYMLDDRGLATKKQLGAFGNSVFIAGRQAGYKFSEQEKSVLLGIQEMQKDNLGRDFIFDQAQFIVPQLEGMLVQINQTLANTQKAY